jgi:ribosome-associated translation inhibitor RaiA
VVDVEVTAEREISRDKLDAAREQIAELQRYTDEPITGARVTLREGKKHAKRPFIADATVLLGGRTLAVHTSGRTPEDALEEASDRLRRQILRITKSEVALRNEPRVLARSLDGLDVFEPDRRHRPEAELKPPAERQIVHRHPYLSVPLSTLEAVRELLDLDLEFFLFTHVRTGEDVVVYRRDDGRIGLLHPQGSELADENDIVVAEPSRYDGPLTLEKAREEMDWLNHRFLYFIDADDGRGRVLYLRHDGDYGLLVPHA